MSELIALIQLLLVYNTYLTPDQAENERGVWGTVTSAAWATAVNALMVDQPDNIRALVAARQPSDLDYALQQKLIEGAAEHGHTVNIEELKREIDLYFQNQNVVSEEAEADRQRAEAARLEAERQSAAHTHFSDFPENLSDWRDDQHAMFKAWFDGLPVDDTEYNLTPAASEAFVQLKAGRQQAADATPPVIGEQAEGESTGDTTTPPVEKKPLTPAQVAALDGDKNGKAGGSKPKAPKAS